MLDANHCYCYLLNIITEATLSENNQCHRHILLYNTSYVTYLDFNFFKDIWIATY